jgi:hypothetical protein
MPTCFSDVHLINLIYALLLILGTFQTRSFLLFQVCAPQSQKGTYLILDTGPDCLNMSEHVVLSLAYSKNNRANNVQPFSTAHACFRISDLRLNLQMTELGRGKCQLWPAELQPGSGSIFVRLPTHKSHVDLFARCAIGQQEERGHSVPNNTSAVQAAGASGDVWSVVEVGSDPGCKPCYSLLALELRELQIYPLVI